MRAARIGQAEHDRHLVECFPNGVVDSAPQITPVLGRFTAIEIGVTATDHKTETWKNRLCPSQLASVNMRLHMIDRNQGLVPGDAQRLGCCQTDQ